MANELISVVESKLAREPATEAPLWAGWNRVCDHIHAHASAMRSKPKSFEVRLMAEVARKAYLTQFVASDDIAVCESAALDAIGM